MNYTSKTLKLFGYIYMLLILTLGSSNAQQSIDENNRPFASENAILDTGIPFVIGAHEAQQSIRGSFGWPTFQEGLVQGVYFRFDPDGYARFAPTPRLDSDVFEVICRPRTYSCMGRKGTLTLILNSRGQLQIKIDGALQGDRFFVSEGVSEIEVPDRILQPLDTQLEILLSTGGDLITRRGEQEKDRVSLTGFYPVSAYLRWVKAQQDYTILPRGWPVPNSPNSNSALTQRSRWNSPMPQPQNFPIEQQRLTGSSFPTQQNAPLQAQPQADLQAQTSNQNTAQINAQNEVAEVKGELKILRELLLERNRTLTQSEMNEQTNSQHPTSGTLADNGLVSDQITALQKAAEQIRDDLARLTSPQTSEQGGLSQIQMTPTIQQQQLQSLQSQPVTQVQNVQPDKATELAKRLQYLMTEIGLDAKTALMLVKMGENQSEAVPSGSSVQLKGNPTTQNTLANSTLASQRQKPLYQDSVVAKILAELEGELEQNTETEDVLSDTQTSMSDQEYQLLSDYFQSVVVPSK